MTEPYRFQAIGFKRRLSGGWRGKGGVGFDEGGPIVMALKRRPAIMVAGLVLAGRGLATAFRRRLKIVMAGRVLAKAY